MAEISVIVPVYNVEDYLAPCIDSIRRQTFGDIEIVCVVDGSRDRSEAVLRLFEYLDGRVKIVVKPNGGLSSARNAGIDASTAPLVMFVDSDDMLADGACEAVRTAFAAYEAEIVTFGAECCPTAAQTAWYEQVLSPAEAYYPRFHPDILFKEASRPFVWRTACRREFLERTGLRFDESVLFGEDQIFHFAAYPKAHGVAFIPDKLYRYRLVREGSLMATRLSDEYLKLKEHVVIADRVCEEWARDGLMDAYGMHIVEWVADFLLYGIATSAPEHRDDLAKRMGALLARHFDARLIDEAGYSQQVRDLCSLMACGEVGTDAFEQARMAYLGSIGYREQAGRPRWKNKLRYVMPMSALGLEERLDTAQVRDEVAQWLATDAVARSRSLEILRLELLARGLQGGAPLGA